SSGQDYQYFEHERLELSMLKDHCMKLCGFTQDPDEHLSLMLSLVDCSSSSICSQLKYNEDTREVVEDEQSTKERAKVTIKRVKGREKKTPTVKAYKVKYDIKFNAEIADTIIESIPLLPIPVQDGNSQQEEIDIVTEIDDVLPSKEVDLFLFDNSIPPGIENVVDDPEGDVHFLKELLIDDSILSHESSDSNFEDNPSISRPPPEPPDDNFDLEPEVISAVMEDINEPDEHFNPGGEIFVSTKIEDNDYFPFMFVIRFFLPYLILPEISPLFLSAESEDTIFDPAYPATFSTTCSLEK
nr:hypothetical protein [Tanacetum cinerariifolium]